MSPFCLKPKKRKADYLCYSVQKVLFACHSPGDKFWLEAPDKFRIANTLTLTKGLDKVIHILQDKNGSLVISLRILYI